MAMVQAAQTASRASYRHRAWAFQNAHTAEMPLFQAFLRFSHQGTTDCHCIKDCMKIDPMCGSGTILIEGAMEALHMAPGLHRTFAAETYPQIPKEVWQEERARARDLIDFDCPFHAYGSDIDRRSVEIAEANARRAGVDKRIDFEVRDLKDFERRSERGTVITNPPYGERLLEVQEAQELYRIMGQKFPKERGWSYYVISPDDDFESLFGRKADKRRKLYNGMIRCQLYMYYKG